MSVNPSWYQETADGNSYFQMSRERVKVATRQPETNFLVFHFGQNQDLRI